MKHFKCHNCRKDLGEMNKGRIKAGAVLLCAECFRAYQMAMDAGKLKKEKDIPDFLKDILK